MTVDVSGTRPRRALSYAAFGAVVVAYLAIIAGVGRLVRAVADLDDELTTTRGVQLTMWVPLGLALLFTYAVVAVLGWWRPVLRDDRPVRRWVWAVPVIFVVCIALAIDYAALGDKTVGYVLALLIATQLVGWGEEGMFRGIGVTTLRDHGLSEGKVALWSSMVFGAVHIVNALGSRGAQAVPQAIAVSFAGYFFYLIRRASGGNWLNSVIHGLFDFSILTGTVILVDQEAYVGALAAILAYLACAVLVLARRRSIDPTPT
ncbi:CPBP family intramembrane glutamic endopeptidase [Motilibacter deserti]|uniref:CPBP family intramembrane metalloprotease n=1 Tax=Motilibacter deserti TaxID=2714956 RepID=A0ABX0GTZ6_9ACTN|nr:CPBP family intramembrane glutamic endopeptidase [Motilibacter deserti]NHC13130.1 CPBP family intramembrane metalloprotease [Motilibacter deserti]